MWALDVKHLVERPALPDMTLGTHCFPVPHHPHLYEGIRVSVCFMRFLCSFNERIHVKTPEDAGHLVIPKHMRCIVIDLVTNTFEKVRQRASVWGGSPESGTCALTHR